MVCNRLRSSAAVLLLCCVLALFPLSAAAAEGDSIGNVPVLLSASGLKDATYEECNFGDAAADAVRLAVQSDIAIVNGGDLTGNLQPGDTTAALLEKSIAADRTLATVELTPLQLAHLLEDTVAHVTIDAKNHYVLPQTSHGAFPQISGMKLSYDPGMPAGERVVSITVNGEKLDLTDDTSLLTLAATEYMLNGGYDVTPVSGAASAGLTLTDAMAQYIRDGMGDYSRTDSRIRPIGIRTNQLPIGYLALMLGLLFLLAVITRKPLTEKVAAFSAKSNKKMSNQNGEASEWLDGEQN